MEPAELEAVVNHHENLNGSGYLGKVGKEISFYSSVIRIVDSYDAMTNDRHYQKIRTIDKAVNELTNLSSTQYDSLLVQEFINFVQQ